MHIKNSSGTIRSLIHLKNITVNMKNSIHVNFEKIISSNSKNCCNNKPIYEITYNLGTKWLVCNECLGIECFDSDIKEKVRISL